MESGVSIGAMAGDLARGALRVFGLLEEVFATELYREQAKRVRDPKTVAVLRKIQADEATHACEERARVEAPDGLRNVAETAARVCGALAGAIAGAAGDYVALGLDFLLERAQAASYRASARLLPRGASDEERFVLERALEDEREHVGLVRDRLGV